jgi:hypothetical protein
VLYFLLTGQPPFGGGTRTEQWRRASQCDFDRAALRAANVPRRLDRIVLKAMAADPADRFASAGDMATALDAFTRRPRRLAIQAGALLLAALAVLGWSSRMRESPVSGPSSSAEQPRHLTPEPVAAGSSSAGPLRIESFEVALHRRSPADPSGLVGVNAFASRLGQDARVQARLSRPAYCLLIALDPDGKTELCYPENSQVAPSLMTTIDFPPDPGAGFALTDGAGSQVFVLVASASPFPPFAEWSKALGGLPWKPNEIEDVWQYNGSTFSRNTERGGVRPLANLPPALEATCRACRSAPGVDAIRALAFPVKALLESKGPQWSD